MPSSPLATSVKSFILCYMAAKASKMFRQFAQVMLSFTVFFVLPFWPIFLFAIRTSMNLLFVQCTGDGLCVRHAIAGELYLASAQPLYGTWHQICANIVCWVQAIVAGPAAGDRKCIPSTFSVLQAKPRIFRACELQAVEPKVL